MSAAAEELSQAAATIRLRAGTASPGPWVLGVEACTIVGADRHLVADVWRAADDAAHVATWSPPVALAVATWLETTAELLGTYDSWPIDLGRVGPEGVNLTVTFENTGGVIRDALGFARLINGTTSGGGHD